MIFHPTNHTVVWFGQQKVHTLGIPIISPIQDLRSHRFDYRSFGVFSLIGSLSSVTA